MTDIVERLRSMEAHLLALDSGSGEGLTCKEAADEIERLRHCERCRTMKEDIVFLIQQVELAELYTDYGKVHEIRSKCGIPEED